MTHDTPSSATRRRQIAGGALGLTLGALAQAGTVQQAMAQQAAPGPAAPRQLGGGISYRAVGRWDVARLNTILTADTPAFAGIPVTYTPARNAVTLYRVTYPSVSPERGNRPVVLTGLVAVPETEAATLPLVSYQHGTVYLREEVPSFPEKSPETQLMIAQFAGQGYALVGADYIGMGESAEPQGYTPTP